MILLNEKQEQLLTLEGYENMQVNQYLNECDEILMFYYKKTNPIIDKIKENYYIKCNNQIYVMKDNAESDEYVRYIYSLDLEGLKSIYYEKFENKYKTLNETFSLLLQDSGWTFQDSDLTKKRNVVCLNGDGIQIIKRICDVFNVRILFDSINKRISIAPSVSIGVYNSGVLDIIRTSKSKEFVTRIVAKGFQGLSINAINNGKDFIENNTYSSKKRTILWVDTSYTNVQDLKDDSILKLNELHKPYVAYMIKANKLNQNVVIGETLTIDNELFTVTNIQKFTQSKDKDIIIVANSILRTEKTIDKIRSISDVMNDLQMNGLNFRTIMDTVETLKSQNEELKNKIKIIEEKLGII